MKNPFHRENKPNITLAASELIVKGRYVIFAVFILLAVYCALSLGKVKTNGELTAFLPAESETRRGLAIMEEEFPPYDVARIMVENVSPREAENIAAELAKAENVILVDFEPDDAHYKDNKALFTVSYAGDTAPMRDVVSGYEHCVYTKLGSEYSDRLAKEMFGVVAIAAAVIALVLLFTSHSYFEVVVFAVVFTFAALLNMGTNHWLGEISSISNSVAVILQLALAIDYAIIFAHRHQHELEQTDDGRKALVAALARSIKEISSSSLTTISGLAALMLMRFRLGYDLGIVLAKGIICSMLTVFLLMPGLLLIFEKPIKRTVHRSLVPDIKRRGGILTRRVPVFLIIFSLMLPFAFVFSARTEYAFSDNSVTEILRSENRDAMHKIESVFGPGTMVILLLPAGKYEKEKAVIQNASALDGVVSVIGLASVQTGGTLALTDKVTAKDFAGLFGVGSEQAEKLFYGYRLENGDLRVLFGDATDDAAYPLADLLMYLFKAVDRGITELDPAQAQMRSAFETAYRQLRGRGHDRIIINTVYPSESAEGYGLVEKLRSVCSSEYGEDVLVMGEITVSHDLREYYRSDSVLIALLTAIFVFLILLVTFKSPVAAAVLVFVIQGSIWINFAIPYFLGMRASFVTNMIVSAIQMGATIDYAIVMMSRYLHNRAMYEKREAVIRAVSESFPTVLTSGSIMTAAGFLIAYRVSDVYVGHIGHAVGRGALISSIVVLTVLPQLILIFDKAIEKTAFFKKKKDRPDYQKEIPPT